MDTTAGHAMRRVDHYDRTQVLQAGGKTLTALTPVFERDDHEHRGGEHGN
ncbi:hypothetical protein [Rhodococcus sp. Leaf233]|nr:hypothetical protein [Rhodococcus sp. Leaf233]